MGHDYFGDYRKAHDELLEDVNIQPLRKAVEEAQAHLDAVLSPYQERLRKAEEGIRAVTLDRQRTIVLRGIEAKYTKPRRSTKWKSVAMLYRPSDELIEEHSSVGSPGVSITVQELG